MCLRRLIVLLSALTLSGFCPLITFAQDPELALKRTYALAQNPIAAAQSFLEKSLPSQAFSMLAPLELERAGQLEFDFFYGLAALQVGENSRAILAFERAVAADPSPAFPANHAYFLRARAELAKLYFQLGENQSAAQAFTALQPLVGADLQRPIQRYLRQLDERAKTPKDGVSATLGLTWGRDSNINSAMTGNDIAIPVFNNLVFTLNPDAVGRKDSTFASNLAARYRHTLSPACYGVAAAGVLQKHHATQASFDQSNVDVTASLTCQASPAHQVVLGLLTQDYRFSQQLARRTQGAAAQWGWQSKTYGLWQQGVQAARFSFPAVPARNAHRLGWGTQWSQSLGEAQSYQVQVGVQTAKEQTDDPLQGAVGFHSTAWRTQLSYALGRTITLGGFGSVDGRRYSLDDAVFLTTRRDLDHALGVVVDWSAGKDNAWLLQLSRQRNLSNIELYSYQRNVLSLTWRWNLSPAYTAP